MCRNKMPTRCNRGFYCRSYCLINMFRTPLCPSSGAQEYCTVVDACGIWCCGFQVAGLVWSWGLCVRFTGRCLLSSILQTGHITNNLKTKLLVWCGAEGYVSGLQDTALLSSILQTGHITNNLKTTAPYTTGSNHCIILWSSWWWA
jgi:hypothetical protein